MQQAWQDDSLKYFHKVALMPYEEDIFQPLEPDCLFALTLVLHRLCDTHLTLKRPSLSARTRSSLSITWADPENLIHVKVYSESRVHIYARIDQNVIYDESFSVYTLPYGNLHMLIAKLSRE